MLCLLIYSLHYTWHTSCSCCIVGSDSFLFPHKKNAHVILLSAQTGLWQHDIVFESLKNIIRDCVAHEEYFFLYRRAEMKQRHDEIRKKYGELSYLTYFLSYFHASSPNIYLTYMLSVPLKEKLNVDILIRKWIKYCRITIIKGIVWGI